MMFERPRSDDAWASHEPGIEGAYSYDGMRALFDGEVDHVEYPDFIGWLWDMERSATFNRVR